MDDGAESVNEAMSDRDASPAATSPVADPGANAAGGNITALPETGGASPPALVADLCASGLLLGCSLLLRSSRQRV